MSDIDAEQSFQAGSIQADDLSFVDQHHRRPHLARGENEVIAIIDVFRDFLRHERNVRRGEQIRQPITSLQAGCARLIVEKSDASNHSWHL